MHYMPNHYDIFFKNTSISNINVVYRKICQQIQSLTKDRQIPGQKKQCCDGTLIFFTSLVLIRMKICQIFNTRLFINNLKCAII